MGEIHWANLLSSWAAEIWDWNHTKEIKELEGETEEQWDTAQRDAGELIERGLEP